MVAGPSPRAGVRGILSLPRTGGTNIEGYASLFGVRDLNDDVVAKGAFAESLGLRPAAAVNMLWRHQAGEPIGVWNHLEEDGRGLFVRGRMFGGSRAERLVRSGAVDGLSIGFRAAKARRDGRLRVLSAVELWEVSLVTFPMLPGARLTRVDTDTIMEKT